MIRKIKKNIPFFCYLLLLILTSLAHTEDVLQISEELFTSSQSQIVLKNWKYHAGDNPEFASPLLEDKNWEPMEINFPGQNIPGGIWCGIGWFRIHIHIDSSVYKQPLSLILNQSGASELFLDGRMLYSIGKVDTTAENEKCRILMGANQVIEPIVFEAPGEHVLAVRFSNHFVVNSINKDIYSGFNLAIYRGAIRERVEEQFHFQNEKLKIQYFFIGTIIASALIHFLLFVFYPKSKGNLYFSLFIAGFAISWFLVFQIEISTSFEKIIMFMSGIKIALIVILLLGSRFIYFYFYPKLSRFIWILTTIGFVLIGIAWWVRWEYYLVYGLIVLVDMIRVLFIDFIKRKRDIKLILGVGSLILILSTAYMLIMALHRSQVYSENIFMWGAWALLISMSVYFARHFALTKKELEIQSLELHHLNERLEESNRKLKEYSRTLKIKVQERTIDLKNKNDDLKNTLEQLRTTQNQLILQENMAALGNLVAVVSHEINNPIGVVRSNIDVSNRCIKKIETELQATDKVNGYEKKPHLYKYWDVLKENITNASFAEHRITAVIKSLSDFTRLDKSEYKKVDLHKNLNTTLALMNYYVTDQVNVIKEYGDIPDILCYASQMNQVFMNLLKNAAQAIDGRGNIHIKTYEKNSHIYICISDTGKGIPSDKMDKLFEFGFSEKQSRVEMRTGLVTSYNIVQRHLGNIKIESEEGKGTTITVILPVND